MSDPDEKGLGRKRGVLGRLFGGRRNDDASSGNGPPEDQAAQATSADPVPATDAESGADAAAPQTGEQPKRGWFQRLTSGLSKTSTQLSDGITSIFTKRRLDATTIDDLEDILIQADLGVETATRITDKISSGRFDKGISADDVRAILSSEVHDVLAPVARPLDIDPAHRPHVILMVGVNGTGKTTTIGKLAARFRAEGRSVLLAAGDTFRAAAIDQLKVWGERTGATVVARDVGADAAGLAYDAIRQAREEGVDVVMVDTAGRLQNKNELMDELEKVVRVIRKIDSGAPHDVILVLDATTGQNVLSQVDVFRDRAGVTGLVMTKLDGTARGGIIVAVAAKYGLPVHAIGVGETVDDLQPFDPSEFARAIAGSGASST